MTRLHVAKTKGRTKPYSVIVQGEAASKANSRKIATINGVTRIIKSDKARSFLRAFQYQVKQLDPMFEEDVSVEMTIFYASRRPDLDESLILDALQGFVYRNDRQVREKHVYWGLDPSRPRVELNVSLRSEEPVEFGNGND
jgi:Holliday junction resolvase RusA-like endonuclease